MSTIPDAPNAHPVHDAFFIRSMSDLRVAKEVLQQHLPSDLLNALDLDAIEICKDKFHSVNLKGKITDMLYRLPLKQSTQPAYVAVLIEHQSIPQKQMPLRVLSYETAIMQQHWERHRTVPLVYTLVYYNGQQNWIYSRDLKDLIQAPPDLVARYALQPFQLIELNQIADQELRHYLWAGVMGLAMKHIYDRDILPALRDFIDLLQELERNRGHDFVLSLLYYLYERGEVRNEDQFHTLIASKLPVETGDKIMTLAQMHEQKGRHEGRQESQLTIAENMIHEGLDPALVAKITGIDIRTVKEMAIAETDNEKV